MMMMMMKELTMEINKGEFLRKTNIFFGTTSWVKRGSYLTILYTSFFRSQRTLFNKIDGVHAALNFNEFCLSSFF